MGRVDLLDKYLSICRRFKSPLDVSGTNLSQTHRTRSYYVFTQFVLQWILVRERSRMYGFWVLFPELLDD